MGIVTMGVPEQVVLDMARMTDSTAFIETGTYHGNTTRWAQKHFRCVHTIERAKSLFDKFSPGLSELSGVTPHLGDSREVLQRILKTMTTENAVFWLDGHWSGGETAGNEDECPLLGELACLQHRTNDIILIDDARLFLSAPPVPHKAEQWPTVSEIIDALAKFDARQFIQIVDDVMFIVPAESELKNYLIKYAQQRSGTFWDAFARLQRLN